MIYAPLIPLQFDDTYGYQNVQSAAELVKFHLINLLMTNPGERISLPSYGVGVRRFLFESFGTGALQTIKATIESQVSEYLSYLSLSAVAVQQSGEHTVQIGIQYSVDTIGLSDILLVSVDASSGVISDTMAVNY
jgi:phage baseplate assembly protein W